MMDAISGFLFQIDAGIFRVLNGSLHNPVFDVLMPFLTNRENWYVPILLLWVGLLIWGKRKGRTAALLMIPLIALTDQVSSHLLKPLVGRVRPCNVLGGIYLYANHQWVLTPEVVTQVFKRSFSFPSSHAANIFGAATLLSYTFRRWTPACLGVAISVAYSRIYVGVHYPSDVLGGALLGVGCALLIIYLWRLYEKRRGPGQQSRDRPHLESPSPSPI